MGVAEPRQVATLAERWSERRGGSVHLQAGRASEQGGAEGNVGFVWSALADSSVAAALVRAPPFLHLPLNIRCFSNATFDIASTLVRLRDPGTRLSCVSEKANHVLVEQVTQFPPADLPLGVTLDLEGLSNSVTPSEETAEAFLDLRDSRFRSSDAVVGKWSLLVEMESFHRCNLCKLEICCEVGCSVRSRLTLRTTSRSPSALPQCQTTGSPVSTSLTLRV
jgi:hypothetical protein